MGRGGGRGGGRVRVNPRDFDSYRESRSSTPAASSSSGRFDSQYHDGGQVAGLTHGGDRHWEAPVHGTDSEGRDVTVSFGRTGSDREGETLISDGHLTSDGFYGRDASGDKLHDHSHGDGTYEDRGRYSG